MYQNILEIIEKLFSQYKLPIINGVLTKDNFIKVNIKDNQLIFIRSVFDNNISLQEKKCSCIVINKEIEYKKYTLYCGEGSMGGDGFIIVMDKDNKIKWLLFHEYINPIENIEMENNKIIGINNCKIKYEFEIDWEIL